jgi:hypothetical protein
MQRSKLRWQLVPWSLQQQHQGLGLGLSLALILVLVLFLALGLIPATVLGLIPLSAWHPQM